MQKFQQTYQILINPNSTELAKYQQNFVGFLFNEEKHISQQTDNQRFTYYLIHTKNKTIGAKFNCYLIDNQLVSPIRAPFGGLEFDTNLNLAALHWFWQEIEKYLQKFKPQSIRITNYPFAYQPENSAHLTHLFLQNGFQIEQNELNYHLNISLLGFEEYLHLSELRRLRKCQKVGFIFQIWESPDLETVYSFIKTARERKGFPISLSFQAFQDLFRRFPADFKVFTVKIQGEIAALTVTIRINENILYNFYPADEAKYLPFSPLVLLHKGLYDYALAGGYKLLDLGIATDKSQANYGLIQFKRNLGSQASLKLSFRKDYS